VADATGNGNTGTASHNTDTLTVAGKLTTALEFVTASSRYVSVADDADLRLDGGGTICMWVKWDGSRTASGGYSPTLVSGGSTFRVYSSSDAGAITLNVNTGSGGSYSTVSVAAALVSGTWKHIAVVIDAAHKRIYANGVDVTSTQGDSRLPADSAATLYLGAQGAAAGFFGGVLDDVRVYKRPLTLAEIAIIYNSGSGTEAEVIP